MSLKFHNAPSTFTVGTITYKATYEGDIQKEFWRQLKSADAVRSTRAHELLEMALKAPEELNIIGDLAEAEGQGGAGYAAIESGKGLTHVMVWNPDTPLPFDQAGAWNPITGWVGTEKKLTGEVVYKGGKATIMPTYITILHELGHFEQFLKKKDWYLGLTATQRNATTPLERTACTSDIEADNLGRNEKVICEQLGLPIRQTYWEKNGTKMLTKNFTKFVP